ncbi:MAG TPA: hypothetical protein VGQ81_00600 [Acidobacteriota bacterium]|jgi:hypothetical protein|nr:hypothetical protein [Acidobacteriota bacterium]
MADELDRQLIPPLFQTVFTISLGATFVGFEMVKKPKQSIDKVSSEVKTLFTIPADAGEGFQEKAKALAAVWMEKAATLVEQCKEAGNRFTEDEAKG